MVAGARVTFRGMPAVKAMVAEYGDRAMSNRLRRAARAGANVFKPAIASGARSRHGSGSGNVPASFAKVPAPKVSTHGGVGGREVEAYVRPKSPLFNIFEPGAQGHQISPGHSVTARPGRRGGKTRKPVLAGPPGTGGWDNVGRKRKGRFFTRKAVQHPGMAARPILAGAFYSHLAQAEDAIARVVFAPLTGGRPL